MLISKTYEVVTPESAEHGEPEESGFEFQAEQYTFKELLQEAENSGCIYSAGVDWLYSEGQIEDYGTCATHSYALHFDRENKPRDLKYWEKAKAYLANRYK